MTYSARVYMLTAICMLPIIVLFIWLGYRRIKKTNESNRIDSVIIDALDYNSSERKKRKNLDVKIIEFWSKLLKPAGVVSPISDDKRNASKLIIISIVMFLITFLFTFNIFVSFVPPIAFLAGLVIYCKTKINAIEAMINEQVPAFLSALKSNVQSNETPERALVSAIDNTAEPLYGELKIVKSLIETGTFETALTALRSRTKNEYLQFLCSCIELSNEVGSNLEEQIIIIEKMIKERQRLTQKTDSAVAENMPILYVTAVAIPFLFIFMYFNNDQVRAFWFNSLLSWVLFFLIFVICAVGCYFGNKIIKSVRKM